jgi:hypothetical protein
MEIPGGTGYQNGQTNAECVIDIHYGDDVPLIPVTEGIYKLMNMATGNAAAVSGNNVVMQKYSGNNKQLWNLKPVDPRIGGDFSFYEITSADNPKTRMNLQDFSTYTGANIMAYSQNQKPDVNEQWYLEYVGNGCYYIRSRESALYLAAETNSASSGVNVVQRTLPSTQTARRLLLWRLMPADVDYETTAPAQPTGLDAQPQSASVFLTWTMGTETDLEGYTVLRAEEGSDEWNTIARRVAPPMEELHTAVYVDNSVLPGHTYLYKVKAYDQAQNQSEPSETVSVTIPVGRALVGHWTMNGTTSDATENCRHAATAANAAYSTGHEADSKALRFNGSSQWTQLPVNTPACDELTIAMWVKASSSAAWQRLFDFGHDTDHYFYLTPTNGSVMRLAIKNGSTEQKLDAPVLPTGKWKHVTVTMAQGKSCIYVDGELKASASDITITPAEVKPVICYLGRSMFNADPYFNGLMQDVRIYNYALSEDEVQRVFNTPTAIDDMATDQQTPAIVHTTDGVRLPQPRRGLNIIDGKVRVVK